MSPQAALAFQIERYRAMTGEQRLGIALDLHELSCDIAREGIRAQHPGADENEVERLLQQRLALAPAVNKFVNSLMTTSQAPAANRRGKTGTRR